MLASCLIGLAWQNEQYEQDNSVKFSYTKIAKLHHKVTNTHKKTTCIKSHTESAKTTRWFMLRVCKQQITKEMRKIQQNAKQKSDLNPSTSAQSWYEFRRRLDYKLRSMKNIHLLSHRKMPADITQVADISQRIWYSQCDKCIKKQPRNFGGTNKRSNQSGAHP